MESGLLGISEIFLIEVAAKDAQQSFAVNRIEPGYRSDHGNSSELLDGTLIVPIAMADHDDTMDRHFCTTQGSCREQSVINRAERRSRGNQNGPHLLWISLRPGGGKVLNSRVCG